jgi:hypothetical protein
MSVKTKNTKKRATPRTRRLFHAEFLLKLILINTPANLALYVNLEVNSQSRCAQFVGKRNKDGIPLPKLLIFGKSGQREVKDWMKQWLK